MNDPFARLGVLMVRRRWWILGIWLALLAVFGGVLAPRVPQALRSGGYIDPDSESAKAAAILDRDFNASSITTAAVVFRSDSLTVDDASFRDQVVQAAQQLGNVHSVRNIETYYASGNPLLVGADRHVTFALVPLDGDDAQAQEAVIDIRKALAGIALEHYVTGIPAVNQDVQTTSEDDLRRSEIFTVPIVVLLLLLVFRTVVAAVLPLVIGVCSIVLALGIVYLITLQSDVSVFALSVTTMIGLGLGVDFSLVVANRFRDELAAGRSVEDATAATMATAGRSVTYSAITVLLAMLALTLLFNLLIVHSISLGVMLVASTSLAAGLTLLPAVLGILGPRIERFRVVPRARARRPGQRGFWYGVSRAIMRRPWVWLGVSLGVLLLLALPVKDLRLYGPSAEILPPRIESVQGHAILRDVFGSGRLFPVQVVLEAGRTNGVWTPEFLAALKQVTDAAAADPRVAGVYSLATLARDAGFSGPQYLAMTPDSVRSVPGAAKLARPFVNVSGDTATLTIFTRYNRFEPAHQDFIRDLRTNILPATLRSGVRAAYVGGDGAIFLDFMDATYQRLPVLVAAVTLVTFILLMMFFQSILLPVKAILMNLASILATYGALVLIFQHGWGAGVIRFTQLDSLGVFTPPTLFAILFGLSTDYEVFLLSRVKEYYRETGDNEEAVALGLQRTAGVITAAGLILVGTFGSFGSAEVLVIKEIGIGLAIGVLLDATIVRVVMVPATMRLMGTANWWMPGWLRKVVPELSEGAARPAPEPSGTVS